MEEPAAAPSPRIGTAEREAAQAALDTHLQAGRLEPEEYGERSAQASVARTADDLVPLFADLPEPHPPTVPRGAALPPAVAGASTGASTAVAPRRGSALERIGPGVVAALPLIAVVLFFVVPIPNAWVFFLLIPIGGMLFAGSRRRRDRDDRDDG